MSTFSRSALLLAASLLAAPLAAQSSKAPPGPDSLRAITQRGRMLADYDVAAWHATDAVMATRPDTAGLGSYLARRESDSTWTVVFGRIDPASGAYLIGYEARQAGAHPDSFVVRAFPTP
jgi:hypothetical protein